MTIGTVFDLSNFASDRVHLLFANLLQGVDKSSTCEPLIGYSNMVGNLYDY